MDKPEYDELVQVLKKVDLDADSVLLMMNIANADEPYVEIPLEETYDGARNDFKRLVIHPDGWFIYKGK